MGQKTSRKTGEETGTKAGNESSRDQRRGIEGLEKGIAFVIHSPISCVVFWEW